MKRCNFYVILLTPAMTQSVGQVRIRLMSQLIKEISRVLHKILKYFNGTVFFCIYNTQPLVLANNLASKLDSHLLKKIVLFASMKAQ